MVPSSIDPFSLFRYAQIMLSKMLSQIQVPFLLVLICFHCPKKCMPGILAIARELLILSA